ncbi:hypothetical protein CLIB1444_04S05864 [[Candida] jaroonii]|uniref:Uncharacterized protein n=1 Tax=[Candida] jaroonii TaxID=467808 RepID=A0ACA9Y724_9ASCO|nr:hypothetical protein CLIB1444_04S05864 [[Candida] jaroonii]
MSGLASKWADDDDLITKAKTQDSHVKSKPLESMWADTPAIATKPKSPVKNHNSRNHKENPDKSLGSRIGNGRQKKDHRETHHQTHQVKHGEESDEEELPPMTEGAKALAARIGTFGKKPDDSHQDKERRDRKDGFKKGTRKSSFSKDHSTKDNFRDNFTKEDFKPKPRQKDHKFTDFKHPKSDSDEELPPMTEGARSLAARLGIVDNSDKPPHKPKKARDFPSHKPKENSPQKPKVSESKYLTPKQKRNQNKEESEMLKVKSEIEKIMKEMDDSHSSWADIE